MQARIRTTEKRDLRLRIPIWVLQELDEAAKEAGIIDKPAAAVATQVLEQWAILNEDENKKGA